jgi:hypothetical protein
MDSALPKKAIDERRLSAPPTKLVNRAMMKWFLMEHRSDAVGLASVPVKRSDGITQIFDTDAAITAAKRRMSIASVSYTVEAIDCSPCPLLFGDPLSFWDIFAAGEADSGD